MPIWMSRAAVDFVEVAQLERGSRGARRVVLVGERRPEDAVQVGALVTERQLQEVAAVRRRTIRCAARTNSSSFSIASSSSS